MFLGVKIPPSPSAFQDLDASVEKYYSGRNKLLLRGTMSPKSMNVPVCMFSRHQVNTKLDFF